MQHAGSDLVADLHQVRRDAGGLESAQRLRGVGVNSRGQLFEGQGLPGERLLLMAGVCPRIAVVEVQQQPQTRAYTRCAMLMVCSRSFHGSSAPSA